MQANEVYFSSGDPMSIEIVDGNIHYCIPAVFRGYAEGQILRLSAKNPMPVNVETAKHVTIRYYNGQNAFTFHSKIMEFANKGDNQFLIKSPTSIDFKMTRREHRVSTPPELYLTMTDGENAFPVKILDLSQKGACLVSNSRLGTIGETFCIELHPNPSSAVVKLSCEIRYIRKDLTNDVGAPAYCHGIKFGVLDAMAERFIEFYLKDKLALLS